MRAHKGLFYFLTLVLFVAVHAADPDPNRLPQCAEDCWKKVAQNCSLNDTECFCADKSNHVDLVTCAQGSCMPKEYLVTRRLNEEQCNIPKRKPASAVNASEVAIFILGTSFFLLRMVAKSMNLGGGWGWDDYTIIASWILTVVEYIVISFCVKNGFGLNIWDVPFDQITKFYKFFNAFAIVYKVQISLAKISVCLFLLRIFQTRPFRYLAYTIIGINAGIGISFALVDAFRCLPAHLTWNGWTGEYPGTCINFDAAILANCVLNIIIDAVIVALPIYEVSKLQLPLHKKISVGVMFMMGSLLTIIAIVRVAVYQKYKDPGNETAGLQHVIHWSVIEVMIAVMCACLPASLALLNHFFPNLHPSSSRRQGMTPSNSGYHKRQSNSKIIKSVTYTVDCETRSEEQIGSSMHSFIPLVDQEPKSQTG